MFIVNLGMQSQCQVLHLISLIQHSQQPCKVGIMPILPMQLSRLKEFKPKVTWLKKGIARIEFQICLVPKPALWGSGRSKGRKKKTWYYQRMQSTTMPLALWTLHQGSSMRAGTTSLFAQHLVHGLCSLSLMKACMILSIGQSYNVDVGIRT